MAQRVSPYDHAGNNSSKLVYQWLLRNRAGSGYQNPKSCSDQIWHSGLKSLEIQEGNRQQPAVFAIWHLAPHLGFWIPGFVVWFLCLFGVLVWFGLFLRTGGSDSNVDFPGLWTSRESFSGHCSHYMRILAVVWNTEKRKLSYVEQRTSRVRLLWYVSMVNLGGGSPYNQTPDFKAFDVVFEVEILG